MKSDDTPTPYHTTKLTTPASFDEYGGFKQTFRYAMYHPWPGGDGGNYLEYWEDGKFTLDWKVDDLAEAQRILKDLTLEDVGIYLPECEA